jgi:hypothetical protein
MLPPMKKKSMTVRLDRLAADRGDAGDRGVLLAGLALRRLRRSG